MKQRIIEIIDELRGVITQQQLNISDNILFSEAISCWRGEQDFLSLKVNRQASVADSTQPFHSTPPTSAQLNVLKNNSDVLSSRGIDYNTIKTKVEASKIIEKLFSGDL